MKKTAKQKIKTKIKTKLGLVPLDPRQTINFRSDAKVAGSFEKLTEVSLVVTRLQRHQETQEELEHQLSDVKAIIWRIQTEELPALMDKYGLSEFKTTDGSKLIIKPFVKASLPSEGFILKQHDPEKQADLRDRLRRAFSYLRKQGAAALIKNLLKADFGKDSEPLAQKALATLRKLGVKAEMSKGVHPQTLTAWVRERLEAGKKVDLELFGVQSGEMAVIKGARIQVEGNESDELEF